MSKLIVSSFMFDNRDVESEVEPYRFNCPESSILYAWETFEICIKRNREVVC